MQKYAIFIVMTSALLSSQAHAEVMKDWKKKVEFGAIIATGNVESQTMKAQLDLKKDSDTWRHHIKADAYWAEENDEQTGEKYALLGKTDYKFHEREYVFVTASYEDDRFSGYDYQFSAAVGYGRRLIAEKTWYVDAEIGPGFRQSKVEDGDTETEGLLRIAGDAEWKINDTSTFTQDLTVEIGSDNTITKSETALVSQLAGNLSFKAAFVVKHQSEVPDDKENTDTLTVVSLIYGF